MASSDYKVIERFLIPDYTGWHIPFAANEMVIAFREESQEAENITVSNWTDRLLMPEVHFARSDPGSDPCGYRTLMVFSLAEKHLGIDGLANSLKSKDHRYIRPKEVDLLALLEVGEIDYMFIYRSVAVQHKLKFLELPGEINLKSVEYADLYEDVSVKIPGNTPGDSVTIHGEPMVYSITMLDNAPNEELAMAFMEFFLNREKGAKIMETMGQNSVIPAKSIFADQIPENLKKYVSQ
jgi:molybdate/tungstate transport system substrate-binding protein